MSWIGSNGHHGTVLTVTVKNGTVTEIIILLLLSSVNKYIDYTIFKDICNFDKKKS